MSRWILVCVGGLLGLGLVGCGSKPQASGPPATHLDGMSLDAIPATPVSGTLAGEDFTVVEARYRVETFPGRERVDLLLSDKPMRRCGLPIVRDGRIAFLRFNGVTTLPSGEARLSVDDQAPSFSIHYEGRPEGDRVYSGRDGGDALVSFGAPELGRVPGKLFACFGDGHDSCIKGSFVATPCFSRVDGRAIREGVGLEDEALEPERSTDGEPATMPRAGGGDTEGSREPIPPPPALPPAPPAAPDAGQPSE
jgi:hypothetical protein